MGQQYNSEFALADCIRQRLHHLCIMPTTDANYALVLGLDFGTYASGIALHLIPGGPLASVAGTGQTVRIISNKPGERFPYTKTRTALLYKEWVPPVCVASACAHSPLMICVVNWVATCQGPKQSLVAFARHPT